jgi:tRNA-(ms[2]io[6]A)-hydroxylase
MTKKATVADLPLRYATPGAWAPGVCGDLLALLNDHAHLEKKAAANALELLNRWPDPVAPENWVATMCAVARDEVEHLGAVTRILSRRGGRLTKNHRNPYANALRDRVDKGGPNDLMDRLMVSALIEARSCERFALLGGSIDDKELAKLYRGLWASEHGHYTVFIQMAELVRPKKVVASRWSWWLDEEAKTIETQPPGPRMHSGV